MKRRVVAIVLAIAALSGCDGSRSLGLVGDSNIAVRPNAMNEGFINFAVDNRAESGASIRGGDCPHLCYPMDWTTKLQGFASSIVVINLGINDTVIPGDVDSQGYSNYPGKVDWMMAHFPEHVPVLWSNLPCHLEPPSTWTGCAAVNAALADAPTRHPNLTVVDWASVAQASHFIDPGDDVHLTYTGALAWAVLMATEAKALTGVS